VGAVWPGRLAARHHAAVRSEPSSSPTDDNGQPAPATDPVLVRRRQLARVAEVAQRAGYALFGIAVVLFVVGFAIGLTGGLVTAIVVALGVGSMLLAPAIVVGYAVKAADREDRERGTAR
jgi:hypothetical protein